MVRQICRLKRIRVDDVSKIFIDATFQRCNWVGQVTIGTNCEIHAAARILHYGGKISLGNNCSINPGCILYGHGGLEIGDDVRVAAYTVFIPANHNFESDSVPIRSQGESRQGIRIDSNVWIGASVFVLAGFHICSRVVIGAGSVVVKSIDKPGVYAGVPARRFREI